MINSRLSYTPEDLSPEEAPLRPLNDLLINRLWWMIHDDRTIFVVDLRVHSRVSDEVDYPLLAFILI